MKIQPGIPPPLPPALVLAILLGALSACRTRTAPTPLPPPPPPPGTVPLPPARPDEPDGPDSPIHAPIDSGRPCNLYLLRWNPDFSSFTADTFLDGLDRLDSGTPARTSWSVHGGASPAPADWAVFARVGGNPPGGDGVAGLCRFTSAPREAPSWRGDGSTARYAGIDFAFLNDPSATDFLSAAELEPLFPSIDWHGGRSGVPLPPGTAAPLALVLSDRLAAADTATFPPGAFAAAEPGPGLASRLVACLCPGLRAAPPSGEAGDAPAAPLRIAPVWPESFDPQDTVPSTFHAPGGDTTVPIMNRDVSALLKPLALPGWRAFALPLAGDAFELLLLVPPRGADPQRIADGIPEALASERTAPGHPVHVFLGLPKTAVRANGPVLRGTVLALDEGPLATGLPPPPLPPSSSKPVRLLLNRPFVLALRDTRTSSLLFLSTVLSPAP